MREEKAYGHSIKNSGEHVSPDEKSNKNVVTWTNAQEAREAFESLLAEVIKTPSTTWKEVVPRLTRDIRFTVMNTILSFT